MTNFIRLGLVFFSAVTIIIADSLVKKISAGQTFLHIIKDPWTIAIYALYFVQIIFAMFIFILKGELAIYTNLFIIFYGIFGIIIGIMFFSETITLVQTIGIAFGLVGAILMNL
jgi:drug/metabolite transporter (DMT)-like permease